MKTSHAINCTGPVETTLRLIILDEQLLCTQNNKNINIATKPNDNSHSLTSLRQLKKQRKWPKRTEGTRTRSNRM